MSAAKSGLKYLLDVIERQSKKGKRHKFNVPIRELERAARLDDQGRNYLGEKEDEGSWTISPQFRDVEEDIIHRTIAPRREKRSISDFFELLKYQTNRDDWLYHNMLRDTINQKHGVWMRKPPNRPFEDVTMNELNERGELGIRNLIEQLKRGEFIKHYKALTPGHIPYSEGIQRRFGPTVQSILEDLLEQRSRDK